MICNTKKLKRSELFNRSKFYFHSKHNPTSAVSLFSGTIHFVSINFGGAGVSTTDIQTALSHATHTASIISQYCYAYGPNKISVDPNILTFTANSSTFSDAQLQSWIDAIEKQYNIPQNDALIILSPQNANNTDAPVSQGVLGYHGMANLAYSFINVLGTGLTLDDKADVYATALSHEIAEMCVDPAADLSNPEVCDPCAGNCGVDYRNYFDINGNWLTNNTGYAFFTDGIVTPAEVNNCPASHLACIYAPGQTSTPNPNPPNPCLEELKAGIAAIEAGNIVKGVEDIIQGIICFVENGLISKKEILEKL